MTTDNIEASAQRRINAFRLASLQGPVLAQPAPIPGPGTPSFNYFYAQLSPSERLRALKEIEAGVVEHWNTMHDSAIESMGLTKPPPTERLLIYENAFDDAHWAELKMKFPKRHKELWDDYQRLLIQQQQGKLQ